ncbi:hypothetical protein KEM54_001827 [Ascosphaera aggregata]|nr:hypothetical protein KEM54_001827 [Ascosphaera aggregata]
MASLLSNLPDEIIHVILLFADAKAAIALGSTSRGFYTLANAELLWRHYCLTDFRHWDARHQLSERLLQPAASTSWKDLYADRHMTDVTISRILDDLLCTQVGRIQKYHDIASFGYDAKDTLVRHAQANPVVSNNLARRYYSKSILKFIHRSVAVSVWASLRDGRDVPLERALGAFDLCVSDTNGRDLEWVSHAETNWSMAVRFSSMVQQISSQLADITSKIQSNRSHLNQLNPRQQALCLADYLLEQKLTGISGGAEYYSMSHNFIGAALDSAAHNSLPLISATIYCAIARRLGLDAHPCGFPFHVHVIVRPRPGYDMDGNILEDEAIGEPMFLDPFRSSGEVPISELRDQLRHMGARIPSSGIFLSPSSTPETVIRCGKNILNSVARSIRSADSELDSLDARHAALWSSVLLAKFDPIYNSQAPVSEVDMIKRYLPALVESVDSSFPTDIDLLQRHIVPLFHGTPDYAVLAAGFNAMRNTDDLSKPLRRRTAKPYTVKYRIGQVFKHRRYRYQAVIVGWDPRCEAEEQWMQTMGVDYLQSGRNQSFYHVLVEDKTTRYVAEENIKPIFPPWSELSDNFLDMAGQYFKRWDMEKGMFISNMQEQYPDD